MADPATFLVTRAIRAVAPRLPAEKSETWLAALAPFMLASGIITPRRVAAFLGELAAESVGFTVLTENLAYSASRLVQVWPSHFPDIAAAAPYSQQPERLANRIYAGRDGNGPESSGDGWRFRGRGLIQLTGRANYQALATATGLSLDQVVARLETPSGAAQSACWVWNCRRLNGLADVWDLRGITERINGGLTGLGSRILLATAALRAMGHEPPPAQLDPDSTADQLMAAEQPRPNAAQPETS